MTRSRKIALWLAGVVTINLMLLFSLNLIPTRAIVSDALKKKLIEHLCGSGECQIAIERLEILLLPEPHIAASKVSINFPGALSGTIESFFIFPQLLPLLSGRVEPAEIQLTAPQMQLDIPDVSATAPPPEALPTESDSSAVQTDWSARQSALCGQDSAPGAQPSAPAPQDSSRITKGQSPWLSLPDLEARLLSLVRALSEKAPGLRLRVERGNFCIIHRAQPLVTLRELSALVSLPPAILALRLECQSDAWGKLAVDGWFDPAESRSTGHLSVDHFRSQLLGDHLPASILKPAGDSPVDLDISFSSQGTELLQATFQASSPSLTLQLGGDRAVITGTALEGMLQMEAGKVDIRVTRLHAEDPQLDLVGHFWSHPDSHEAAYWLECRNTNATAIREVALALVSESEVVQDVFAIVRGGHVPLATFEAHGRSAAELLESRNLVVKGRLENGEVFIRQIDLKISEAQGDALILQGILKGTNLQGRVEQSIGHQGSLTVALAGKDGPFHLDIAIEADLAQLPPVLARVVDNQAFLRELALVRDVTGTASGRLLLGDTLNHVRTRVEVAKWNLKGLYERLPFPVALEARALVYEGHELAVEDLRGQIGRSEVHAFSGSLSWDQELVLELSSPAKGDIRLEELFPWLATFSTVRDNPWKIQTLEGALRVNSLSFKGPLAKPDNWRFALTGQLQKVTTASSLLGNPVKIKSGTLSWTHQSFEAAKWEFAFLDAALAVSGKLTDITAARPLADFAFQGTLGLQSNQWLSDLVELPTEFRVRTPLSLLQSRFTLDHSGHGALSAVFRTGDGAELSLDLDRGGQELALKQLKVVDQESNAIIAVNMKPGEVACGFQGNLAGSTLDRLLAANSFFKGSITGNFSVQLFKDRLADSNAEGKLTLGDFCYGLVPEQALRVNEASIEAREHVLELKSASILLQDEPLALKGTIRAGQNQMLLDLDLTTQGIAWEKLQSADLLKILGDTAFGGATAEGMTFWGVPVRGALRIQADHFAYANYTWKPFLATLAFAPDGLNLEVARANLCTIPTPARLIPHPQGGVLLIHPAARNLDLDITLACLWDRKGFITGSFDLEGEITAKVQAEKMSETFRGNLNLEARDGRVYRSTVLSKIFTLLNVTEVYRGKLPDLMHAGCAYDSINARATLKNGKVLIEDAVFDGHCAKMVWTGEIDLASLKVDFAVLVSPFKTVDTVIRYVPLLSSILGGTLVTIPVQVAGDITDPDVTPLPPTAVDAGLLNTMKKVLQFPFSLEQPLQ